MKEIPNLHYFRSKNSFSGSSGLFRYRLDPDGELLCVAAWFGPNCMERTDEEKILKKEFPLDTDGLEAAVSWLEQVNKEEHV